MQASTTFSKTEYDQPIVEVAVALASQRDGCWHVSGTAVSIAQNLLLTCKHVVEHHWSRFESSDLSPQSKEGTFNLFARQYHSSPNEGVIWTVREFWFHEKSDLALLKVESGDPKVSNYRWPSAIFKLSPPNVGDAISAFGYRESSVQPLENNPDRVIVQWNETPTTSKGSVKRVFTQQRDSTMLPFPCFETNSRYDPGMSGGPVFCQEGKLRGLICSGIKTRDESQCISYAVSLWPLMGLQIKVKVQGDTEKKSYTILELAERGVISTEDSEKVKVTNKDGIIHTTMETLAQ